MQNIRCLCCRKRVNFIAVEPDFYCENCTRKKEIHNSENDINPVKWYHKIEVRTREVQDCIDKRIRRIKDIVDKDKAGTIRILEERISKLRQVVEYMVLKRSNKIRIKESIIKRRYEIDKKGFKNSSLIKDISDVTLLRNDLLKKTMEIQMYLNKIQLLFIHEMLHLLPINASKFGLDSISGLELSINLSQSMLEPNDLTASGILMLVILSTSISFVLDLHFSSMNIREFTVETLCRLNQPLKRDEIMSVYEMLVKLVHHIVQATLHRVDVSHTPSLSSHNTSYSSFNAKNYPINNLYLLKDNLKKALLMNNLSNPYILHLPNMFMNTRLDDFCNSTRADQLNGLSHDTNSLDFVEISSNVPFDDISFDNDTQADMCDSGPTTWFKFKWIKKSFM